MAKSVRTPMPGPIPPRLYGGNLIEFGYPEPFAQDQAGHSYASTTAIYTGVSDEFRNRLLVAALRERHARAWEDES
jgi:integrase/recombinase XerD